MHTYKYIIHPHFLKKRINMSTFDEKVYKYKVHAYMCGQFENPQQVRRYTNAGTLLYGEHACMGG